jgi:LCP family protein required for cell wall assembly
VPDVPRRHPIARTMLRLLGGSVLIALLATAASATTFFEGVGIVADALGHGALLSNKGLAPTHAGQPITILVLGSDRREESSIAEDRADPRHSDTIMLIHMDPKLGETSLMSVPRDLQASFTAFGQTYSDVKINSAFTYGGPPATVRTVEHLLHIKINDVIVIDFQAFAFLVNGLGCVYVDVDHHFYNPGYGDGYAHIDIAPGYRPLCYYQALSYVRYREGDSTYARDAREQDFLRQAKQQLSVSSLLTNPAKLKKVLDQVASGTSSNISGSNAVLRLVEIAEDSVNGPVRQVQFPDDGSVSSPTSGSEQVDPSPAQINGVVQDFLYDNTTALLPPKSSAPTHGKHHHHHHSTGTSAADLGLVAVPSYAMTDARDMQVNVPFPVEIPTLTPASGFFPGDDDFYPFKEVVPQTASYPGLKYAGYRITWEDGSALGAYFGIDGLNWTNPPLFHNAPTREIDGRTYMFVLNGKSYQDIGWIKGNWIYWVSNTIFDNLSNAALLRMAESAVQV